MPGVVVRAQAQYAAKRALTTARRSCAIAERQAIEELQGRVERHGDAVNNLGARLLRQEKARLLGTLNSCGELGIDMVQEPLQTNQAHMGIVECLSCGQSSRGRADRRLPADDHMVGPLVGTAKTDGLYFGLVAPDRGIAARQFAHL